MKKLKMFDLFSGGGMFTYAAEKLVGGIETIQFCEIDSYCQKVLKKHWPLVPIHDDIRTFKPEPYSADVISAGFPCTDISVAGKGLGITKETRSGLFYELMRVVCVVRPKYVILENVAAILNNGMGTVLGELSKAGFDACWSTFRASDFVRACHHRDRWWLLATNRDFTNSDNNGSFTTEKSRGSKKTNGGIKEREDTTRNSKGSSQPKNSGAIQFNAPNTKSITRNENEAIQKFSQFKTQEIFRDRNSRPNTPLWRDTKYKLNPNWREYGVEPAICRTDDGIASGLFTNRTERLKLLGNGLIPQCAAIPLQRILDLENDSRQT
jgi:DNA (cytosine-5)-methyltransferase 1